LESIPGIPRTRRFGPGEDAAQAQAGAFKGALDDADAMKEQHFIDSITSGKFINQAAQGAESTLSAILGRYAAYTGRSWKWKSWPQSTRFGARA